MLVPYLTFNGNAEEAFSFYKTVLNGEFLSVQRLSETPFAEQAPEATRNKIMHISLEAPGGFKLMGSDHFDFMGEVFVPGNNFSLSLHPESESKADELFKALSAGGTIIMPMEKVYWGAYFGMFIDKFGIKWLINC